MATNRLGKLRAMRTDSTVKTATAFDSLTILGEVYDRIAEDEPVKYAIGAMQEVGHSYTRSTFAEGDRIKAQLNDGLNTNGIIAEFEYQGSVTNNTHVRVHSDLDLLTVATDFHTVEPPNKPTSLYIGNVIAELKNLRSSCVKIIKAKFPTVIVDDTKGKCIALSGGSLRREIDVVIANWWHTIEYENTYDSTYRGVKVLDVHENTRHSNKPFLHNSCIQRRDAETFGNLRRVIRLLKSLRYNADNEVDISSYDISAIAYSMPNSLLAADSTHELVLVENSLKYLASLVVNSALRESLWVPNGTRKIFGPGGASEGGLIQLYSETKDLSDEIKASLSKSMRKMADAQIRH